MLSDSRCVDVDDDMPLGLGTEPQEHEAVAGTSADGAAPNACMQAHAVRCVDSRSPERERCVDGAWMAFTACSDGEVCAGPARAKPGECVRACEPGALVCMGRELLVCNDTLVDYDLESTCELGCNAQRNRCNVCDPTQAPRCEGQSTRIGCRSDGSSEDREPCASVCSRGECVECVDASQCSSDDACKPKRCDTAVGRCVDSVAPKQTPCGDGRYCDGTGACVECVADSNCAGYEMCAEGACSARPSLMFIGGENGSFEVLLSRGYSLRLSAQYSSTNTGRMRVGISGSANCLNVGAETASCTIPASNQDRTLTLTGPMEICRKPPRIRPNQIILGFEDYNEADPNVADCLDPTVTLDANPEG